jgi:hypothetical protein
VPFATFPLYPQRADVERTFGIGNSVPTAVIATIRRTGVTEHWIEFTASVRLDVEGPDDVAPLLGFLSDELAEGRGRAGKNRAAQVGKP